MGDVVTGRPYAEGEGLPPVSEHLKRDGHCQFRGLDMSEIDSGEQLRQVTLSGAGELCLVTHPRIEVARGPPERGEGPPSPARSHTPAATKPPGRVTRDISLSPRTGSAMKCTTSWASVRSKLSSGKGRCSAAPQRTSTAGKRTRIAATNAAEGSIAETALAPNRCTNCVVRAPGPQPTSNAR